MNYPVSIDIMLRREISDPQGQTVEKALPGLGFDSISDIRIGKRITMNVEAENEESARLTAEAACRKLLANPVIEDFSVLTAGHEASVR